LIDERINWYREALERIGESDCDRLTSGASFVKEFGKAIYPAAVAYLKVNKHVILAESLRVEQDVSE